jgi:hypothetical protein
MTCPSKQYFWNHAFPISEMVGSVFVLELCFRVIMRSFLSVLTLFIYFSEVDILPWAESSCKPSILSDNQNLITWTEAWASRTFLKKETHVSQIFRHLWREQRKEKLIRSYSYDFARIVVDMPVKVAERSKAWTVFARSDAVIVCSNPT